MRVMAIDPGGTTGLAWAELPDAWREVGGVRSVISSFEDEGSGAYWGQGMAGVNQVTGPTEDHKAWAILMAIADVEPDVVVVEDFRTFPGQAASPDQSGTEPMRLLAKIDFMWFLGTLEDFNVGMELPDGLPELVKQMPGERSWCTDTMLRRWELWRTPRRGGGPHAMDAMRHLLTYLRKQSRGRV